LLGTLLVTGYRRIVNSVISQTDAGNLRLAFFIVAVAYNFSEGGFKMMHPVWLTFLLSTAVTQGIVQETASNVGMQTALKPRAKVPGFRATSPANRALK